jgi:hypothetical protein
VVVLRRYGIQKEIFFWIFHRQHITHFIVCDFPRWR